MNRVPLFFLIYPSGQIIISTHKSMSRYLFQEPSKSWFAESLEQQSDRVEIDAWDLWISLEVSIITEKTENRENNVTMIKK